LNHLDLFSGIGGFALAASWVWPDHNVVSFCEIDPFCRKVLKKHWPDAPIHDDIKTFDGEKYAGRISLLTGGFPCQPYSVAGKQRGKDDDRALWPEMLRVISEIHPAWIIGENVGGFVNMGFDDCASDLESEGYEVQAFIIPACALNAPHRRDRVWIVAHSRECDGLRRPERFERRAGEREEIQGDVGIIKNPISRGNRGRDNGNQTGSQYTLQIEGSDKSYSDVADSPTIENDERERGRMADQEGCREGVNATAGTGDQYAPNSGNQRLQGRERPGTHDQRPAPHGSATERHHAWDEPWIEAATRLCRVDDGLPGRVDKHRTGRLKALGNAIVPQVVYEIMKAIKGGY